MLFRSLIFEQFAFLVLPYLPCSSVRVLYSFFIREYSLTGFFVLATTVLIVLQAILLLYCCQFHYCFEYRLVLPSSYRHVSLCQHFLALWYSAVYRALFSSCFILSFLQRISFKKIASCCNWWSFFLSYQGIPKKHDSHTVSLAKLTLLMIQYLKE